MAAPKDRSPQQESEHLETLAKMLREIDEHLDKEVGRAERLPRDQTDTLP
jgi:hypothetical protein